MRINPSFEPTALEHLYQEVLDEVRRLDMVIKQREEEAENAIAPLVVRVNQLCALLPDKLIPIGRRQK